MLAHFFPDVSTGLRPRFPAGTGFYREPATAGQLVCAADAGWPGAGRRGPQVKLFCGEAPGGCTGRRWRARERARSLRLRAGRSQCSGVGAGAINRGQLAGLLSGLLTLTG
ncbi:hypothetical protein CKY04_08565 [Photorhabdus sp. S8-52]|nr:hypothetical protein CKY03_24050 [Photorhabdus sp. S9-53]RAX00135.1 hypothetical protein CKY05_08500 [Photorhabdus sp. S10-54]RAX04468.1 hypothetical protein CKY04_08565 [Photorhabdus sp. S8-52]